LWLSLGEPVPRHDPRPRRGRAVQDPGGGAKIDAGKRERRRQGVGVNSPGHFEVVDPGGEGGDEALQAAERGRYRVEEQRRQQRPDPAALDVEAVEVGGVDGQVQAETE